MKTKFQTDRASEAINEYKRLASDRGNWESHCQEIAERIMPSVKDLFQSNINGQTKGQKKSEFVFDSTASVALGRFGAILDSLLTPRNSMWHRLMANDENLNKDRNVRLYFEEVNRILFRYRYAPKANFASQNQLVYEYLGAFGTGAMFIDPLWGESGIRYKNIHIGELFVAQNHQGQIDKCIRYFALTARQALQKWEGKLSDEFKTKAKNNPEAEFYFLHCVKPRKDYDPNRQDFKGMIYESLYVSIDDKAELEEGGYSVFPYTVPRYRQAPNEVLGRSPAMEVLPAIKTLNEQKKSIIKQGHRVLDPVLLAHDDGILDSFSLKPGAINPGGVSADGRLLVQALPTGNIAVGKDMMDEEKSLINDAFLVSLFQILTENPEMSATEVLERTREKGILLAPTLGRVESEHLGSLIERELDVLAMQQLLPPMPGLLLEAGGGFRVDYDSPLSRAARAEEASGTMRAIENALQVVNVTQDQSPLDHFDWDVIVPDMSYIQGVPSKYMRDPKQIAAMRQKRQEAADTQTAIQAGPSVAALAKAMPEAAAK